MGAMGATEPVAVLSDGTFLADVHLAPTGFPGSQRSLGEILT
jgi:hypothetical protein